ncbi:MAG: hypothetical protein V9H26_20890 [Verrucomicrobiota bacterium]
MSLLLMYCKANIREWIRPMLRFFASPSLRPMNKRMVQTKCYFRFGMMEIDKRLAFDTLVGTNLREPPHLVSSAVYGWVGKQILPNGTLEDINTSDVSKPFDMAARYDVDVPTNCSGLKLPLSFKLTRFDTERSENKEPKVVSTVVASVIKVSLLTSNESLEVKVPGKTFVSDYRLSAGELKGAHLGYLLDSNTPPTTEQIKQGSLYKRTSEIAKTSPPKPYLRWALLAFLLAFPVVAIIFWKYLARTRESSNTVPSQ